MESTQILRKNPDITTRIIDGEIILIPLYASSKEADFIYVLDDIGTAIWDLVNGKRDVDQIQGLLLEDYEIAPEHLRRCVSVFLGDLKKIKAVI
jgi:hypothetical protein